MPPRTTRLMCALSITLSCMVITLFGARTQPAGPTVRKDELVGIPFDEGEGRMGFASDVDAIRQEIAPKAIVSRHLSALVTRFQIDLISDPQHALLERTLIEGSDTNDGLPALL